MSVGYKMSRRRAFWCVMLLICALAISLAFVSAQHDIPVAAAAADDGDAARPAEVHPSAEEKVYQHELEEEERLRQQREAEHRRQQEEQERQRREAEERARREEEQERQRREAEERARREEEQEREHRAAEERAGRKKKEQERERRAAEEKAKRTLDSAETIRRTAKRLPEGCVKAVERYLFRVHEERQPLAAAVSEARASLNEARVHAPKELSKLEATLARHQDALLVYDIHTLRMYGGPLPKTCIAESQAWLDRQPAVESTNNFVQTYSHFYHLLAAHSHTLYFTAQGVMEYLIKSYMPTFYSLLETADLYYGKARTIYTEVMPSSPNHSRLPLPELAKQVMTMVGYAMIPVGLGIAAGIVATVAFPPVLASVVLYEYIYKIWIELFLAYYIYGAKLPEGFVSAAKGAATLAKAGEWNTLGNNALDAFLDLVVDSNSIYYNAIIAIFLLSGVVFICGVWVYLWCSCCIPGVRQKQRAHSLGEIPANTGRSHAMKGPTPSTAPKKNK